MHNDELILHFTGVDGIRAEFIENGMAITKVVTLNTLLDCLTNSLAGVKVKSGILPIGTVSYSVDMDKSFLYIVTEFPDEKADVTYMHTTYSDFPLPRLLFGYKIEDSGRISSVNIGVPALGKLTPDTQMYYYPFSNVNQFSLCTGRNPLPHIEPLQSLSNLSYYILSLPDNDDFYKEGHNKLGMGHRDLMEHLQDKNREYYYDSVLIQMKNKTLKDFI